MIFNQSINIYENLKGSTFLEHLYVINLHCPDSTVDNSDLNFKFLENQTTVFCLYHDVCSKDIVVLIEWFGALHWLIGHTDSRT